MLTDYSTLEYSGLDVREATHGEAWAGWAGYNRAHYVSACKPVLCHTIPCCAVLRPPIPLPASPLVIPSALCSHPRSPRSSPSVPVWLNRWVREHPEKWLEWVPLELRALDSVGAVGLGDEGRGGEG